MANLYEQRGIHKINFIELGPGAGYAYTLIIKRRFFLTGSFSASLDFGWVREVSNISEEDHFNLVPNFIYRVAGGYNSRLWNVSLSWVSNRISARGASSADKYLMQTGNVRLTLARQFRLGPKLKKSLEPLDKMLPEKKSQ
jgi:hypothetical protein